MQLTPTITFRGLHHSRELESDILTRIHKLETYYPSIIGCRLLVELEGQRHEHGNRIHVRIEVTVPGGEIAIAHDTAGATVRDAVDTPTKALETGTDRKHAQVAIREAFAIARRRLQNYGRQQRAQPKTRLRQARGRVSRLADDHGFLEGPDGHNVYFHRNSVLKNGFDRLAVGNIVAFVEEGGEKGPQASTVRLVRPRKARLQGAR